MYAQEAGAEIATIKHLIERIKFDIKIHLIKSHEKQVGTYEQNPMKHLIKECDRKAKTIREESRNKMNCTNIKFYGSYTMKRNGELQSRAVKEVIRILDAREEENEYARRKYKHKFEFIDMEARNAFKTGDVTTAMIKFTHGFNHYRIRNSIINKEIVGDNYLRCSETQTSDNIIKYR